MSTKLSNVSLIAVGLSEVREGQSIADGGIVHIAEGIVASWSTVIAWSYGSGDDEVKGTVRLCDMYKPRHLPDGSVDSKYLPAVYRGIAETFGVDGELSTADKVAFKRAFGIAAAKAAGVAVEFVDAKVTRKGKDAKVRAVRVPAGVGLKLVTDEGKLTEVGQSLVDKVKSASILNGKELDDEAAFTKAEAFPVDCVGGKSLVFDKRPSATDIARTLADHAVKAGIIPAPKPRQSQTGDAGAEFLKSVAFVSKLLDEHAAAMEKGEGVIALANEGEKALIALGEKIAAFVAANIGAGDDEPDLPIG